MKINSPILKCIILAGFITCLLSCTKEGADRFEGNYSFKTSGTLSIVEKSLEEGSETETDTLKIPIPNKRGQMDIIRKEGNQMIVTMNILGGEVITFEATAQKKILTLKEVDQLIDIPVRDTSTIEMDVQIGGFGERFGDVIIFRMEYKGSHKTEKKEYEILDSAVDCVAKLN